MIVSNNIYQTFTEAQALGNELLAILLDPDKFELKHTADFLRKLPRETTHLFVGGSTVATAATESLVKALKQHTSQPIVVFPGDFSQITEEADALLFLSLLSGRNPEFLVSQQIKGAKKLIGSALEVISTAYLLIDGGNESAVARVTQTVGMSQLDVPEVVATAKAGEYMGAKLIYLEAGSGAHVGVSSEIISEVKKVVTIPIIVGGGIRSQKQKQEAYNAGATMVVMGTAFENLKEYPVLA